MTENAYIGAMKRTLALFMALFAILFRPAFSSAQDYVTTAQDKAMAEKVLNLLHEKYLSARISGEPMETADLMVIAAKELIGVPYVAGTLDEDPLTEKMRVYLTKTDCILFVETCLNLARTVIQAGESSPSFNDFVSNIARTRYRKDPPYSYSDRIHYTTEWIRRQEGTLKDMTMELSGEINDHPISFMSEHPKSYKQLADADNIPRAALDLKAIEDVEKELKRLAKDLKGLTGEIARATNMLANPGFVSKAPTHLVEAEKEKLETNKKLLEKLEARIAEMESLR